MSYEISLQEFKGPLEKLLELIEAQKLEITEISLAAVTDDFLKYLRALEGEAQGAKVLSDFLVIAARLLLIKSKALLPTLPLTEEEQADIQDLESRLKLYREFSIRGGTLEAPSGALFVRNAWSASLQTFTRPLFAGLTHTSFFFPPPSINSRTLFDALERLTALIGELQEDGGVIEKTRVSIEEKTKELLERLEKALQYSFAELKQNRPKGEIVALFLAILQLLRNRHIHAEQKGQFDDIIIGKKISDD